MLPFSNQCMPTLPACLSLWRFVPFCLCARDSNGLCYMKNLSCSSHLFLLFSVSQPLPSTLNNCSNNFLGCLAHIFFHLSLWLIWKLPLFWFFTEKPKQLVTIGEIGDNWWKTKTIGDYLIGLGLVKAEGIQEKKSQKLFIYSSISMEINRIFGA